MSTAGHAKELAAAEGGRDRNEGDGLFAGVDDISASCQKYTFLSHQRHLHIDLIFGRIRALERY